MLHIWNICKSPILIRTSSKISKVQTKKKENNWIPHTCSVLKLFCHLLCMQFSSFLCCFSLSFFCTSTGSSSNCSIKFSFQRLYPLFKNLYRKDNFCDQSSYIDLAIVSNDKKKKTYSGHQSIIQYHATNNCF